MSVLIKLSSLTDEEKLSFVRNGSKPGRYVLAKVIRNRPWDTGSVWGLTKQDGQLAIARIDDLPVPPKDEIPSGISGNHCTCGHAYTTASVGAQSFEYCPVCQPKAVEAIQKVAGKHTEHEIVESVGSGIPSNLTVTSDYYLGKVIPTLNRWVEKGWSDFSVEGIIQRSAVDKKAGLLNNLDVSLMVSEADRLVAYAKHYALAAGSDDLFENNNHQPKVTVTSSKADKVLQSLATLKPTGMSWDSFLNLYEGLRESKKTTAPNGK